MTMRHFITGKAEYKTILQDKQFSYSIILCDEMMGDAYCEKCATRNADFGNRLFLISGAEIDPESLFCAGCGEDCSDYKE
jgi:hypothetical protein